ncbi:MAG: LytTR family DNA-binding domain-containing protein [Bacteroidota bacterium]|nr:LytTR family DNA-binding domain-containing protein [Bacteroidota bacterium]
MNIIIIEDERLTAEDLAETITTAEPAAKIVAILYSVKEAIYYFRANDIPDLIFSDIQLGDGLSFEIFKSVSIAAPVIFCTAYDEYALNAFKANGIEYILKPFTAQTIENALKKYNILRQSFSANFHQYDDLLKILQNREEPKSASILVHHKDKIIPVKFSDIALFYIENGTINLLTTDKKIYSVNKNMEELEQIAGKKFFRINRQCLLNRKVVVNASYYFSRKLSINITVPFKETLTVSKEKMPQFLKWLENS